VENIENIVEDTKGLAAAEFRKSMEALRKRPLTIHWRKWRGKRVAIINGDGEKINSRPAKSIRGPCRKYKWTEEDEEIIRKNYIRDKMLARKVRKLLSQPHTPGAIRKKAAILREEGKEK